ncbi:MAG TPA: dienelactone hydrolase family protein [Terriglobia bacterium]|nr:dienelactone hydrolase family protein [Terriglobia bacterium]
MADELGKSVAINVKGVVFNGVLRVPDDALGVVLFACANCHRNCTSDFLANFLPQNSLATLRVDLLTAAEDALYEDRLDMDLLTQRLAGVASWIKSQPGLAELPLGLFGVGTSGAAALTLAAAAGSDIFAIVGWDGRPDLAESYLASVKAPILLIVGEKDELVRELNSLAFEKLRVEKELLVISGATHRFDDFGALEAVGERAADWFAGHLAVANKS